MVSFRTYVKSSCSSACNLIFSGAFAVSRCLDHDVSKILLSRIDPTCYSFTHQNLSLIKIKGIMPRQVPDTLQELFLTCDTNTLIASLPGFNSMTRQAQLSNLVSAHNTNNNPFTSSNDNYQQFAPLINLHNAPSCLK